MNSLELIELNFNELAFINGGVDKDSMWYKLGYAVGTYLFEHGIPGK
ncbi:hypothetical protein [Spirosoma foliorum]|uniref:Uncharacterized protein n=1 Tax=Spirosoma foliorum TaxID=2710596 RepID=A0A7G5GQS5_9BACT|nr:hypothetical protein [Spirosoma foliorum]QMW01217.1 hypothetical protein H3H32_25050 [Spirosoma foliorum]